MSEKHLLRRCGWFKGLKRSSTQSTKWVFRFHISRCVPFVFGIDVSLGGLVREKNMAEAASGVKKKADALYSVAVIGLGPIGSAACLHLSAHYSVTPRGEGQSSSVVAIGAPEPADLTTHLGVFGSHYDEGRLTRIVDKNPVWSKLAARSIASYGESEQESGIQFHSSVGSLRVTPFYKQPTDSLLEAFAVGKENGAAVELLEDGDALMKRFPYLHFQEKDAGIMEHGGAGYVNPRAMIRAQLAVAAKHGACIVPESVVAIDMTADGVNITTDAGKVLSASKVLICADAYTNLLLPGQDLVLHTYLVSVLLAEIGDEEEMTLQGMPSIIWRLESHPYLHSVYLCPPIRYPDGKLYIKIGGTEWEPVLASSTKEITDWFHDENGRQVETDALHDTLQTLLPQISFKSFHRKPCMVTYTSHNYPYIQAVDVKPHWEDSQLYVATGGCGAAAKSAYEIGHIGALLVSNGQWNYDLDEHLFNAVYVQQDSGQGTSSSQRYNV